MPEGAPNILNNTCTQSAISRLMSEVTSFLNNHWVEVLIVSAVIAIFAMVPAYIKKRRAAAKVEKERNEIREDLMAWKDLAKEQEAQKEAAQILAQAMPKLAADTVSEFTSKVIDLPTEEFKWKLIWREWRNISLFEKLTGVELLIDDTPLSVRISSFDSEKRFVAAKTLEILIKDWRINPFYIEKVYNQVVDELEDKVE